MYILVLDEDKGSNILAKFILTKQGYEVEVVDNPEKAFQIIQRREPSLLILDVALPYMNGFQFAEKLCAKGYELPFLFMTAQDTIGAKFQRFKFGTNDYIRKPYDHQELVQRVQGIMFYVETGGNIGSNNKQKLCIGDIEFIPKDLQVRIKEKSVTLTRTEAGVFKVLIDNPNRIIRREQIVMEVWNGVNCNTNIVEVYISRLRAKIEDDLGRPKYITSTRGAGYKLTGG